MSTLIFDIETIGEDYDSLDETSRHMLTRWIKKTAENDEEYKAELEDIKNGLGFSPLTGQIAAIGVLDADKDQGVIYFQAPDAGIKEFEEDCIKYKPCTEKEMLEKFWQGAVKYNEFVSFNGRGFDVPFMLIRSAIHKLRPTVDLMSNRYLSSQKFNAKHIDLMDQLSFYGATYRRRGQNLHMYCRAFGIKSPKADGVNGDDVAALFKNKCYADIARYNSGDLRATKELLEYWKKYVSFDFQKY